jgi:beta-N-acetylglucosaminidase/SH3-like domain-containing protein
LLILVIGLTCLVAILPKNTYAITQSREVIFNGKNIDENLFPGYPAKLNALLRLHPNWTFTLFYTDLSWSDVIANETTVNHSRSLVQGKSGEWLCEACKGNELHVGGWYGASAKAVAYTMDPRNYLKDEYIFQFESLSYNASVHTKAGVEEILAGTFMSNKKIGDYYKNEAYGEKTFSDVIMEAAISTKASPYYLASRIRLEVGAQGSASIFGTYDGYEGYFNFYNIGAYANNPIANALSYARGDGASDELKAKYSLPWNTPEKAILGGAKWIYSGYIEAGQDTVYLQKFDVDNNGSLYSHQYMQNIEAPRVEGRSTYNSYAEQGILNSSFNFIIPLYKNMGAEPSPVPNTTVNSSIVTENVQIKGTDVNIRKGPGGTYESYGMYDAGYKLLRIEKANEIVNSQYWDKLIMPDGSISYVATQYLEKTTDITTCSKVAYINAAGVSLRNGPGTEGTTVKLTLTQNQKITVLTEKEYTKDGYTWNRVKLENGTQGYVASNYIKLEDTVDYIIDKTKKKIKTKPDVTIEKIKKNNKTAKLVSGTVLGTGSVVDIDGIKYDIVKIGDIDGNGEANEVDAAKLLGACVGKYKLTDITSIALDIDADGKSNEVDAAKLLGYCVGKYNIEL